MEKAETSKNEPGTGAGAVGPKKPAQAASASAQGKRYGEAVKRLVVEQIEGGKLTVAQAQRLHGIAGAQTIRGWQARYGKAGGGVRRGAALAAAAAQIERLKQEKAQLEHALARSTVKAIVLESALEEAEAQYGADFKKKFAAALSSVRAAGSGRKG